jgi:hypothetical protein
MERVDRCWKFWEMKLVTNPKEDNCCSVTNVIARCCSRHLRTASTVTLIDESWFQIWKAKRWRFMNKPEEWKFRTQWKSLMSSRLAKMGDDHAVKGDETPQVDEYFPGRHRHRYIQNA